MRMHTWCRGRLSYIEQLFAAKWAYMYKATQVNKSDQYV